MLVHQRVPYFLDPSENLESSLRSSCEKGLPKRKDQLAGPWTDLLYDPSQTKIAIDATLKKQWKLKFHQYHRETQPFDNAEFWQGAPEHTISVLRGIIYQNHPQTYDPSFLLKLNHAMATSIFQEVTSLGWPNNWPQ